MNDARDKLNHKGQRLAFWNQLLTILLLCATAAFLVVNSVLFLARQDAGHQTLNRIDDCTTPGKACYQRSQEQQRQAILRLEQIVIAANFCTRDTKNDTVKKVTACVSDLIGT